MKRFIRDVAVVAILGAGVFVALRSTALAGPPVCPAIYDPVICDNGKIYPNQCEADRHHAKNCVPYDDV